jgi:signal transduction histidine kinase
MLNPGDPYMPAFRALDQATRTEIRARAGPAVEFYAETLDMLRFAPAGLEQGTRAFLREKYRHVPVDAIVAVETTALDFAERHGGELWPGAAIVFNSVPTSVLERRTLGPRTIGVPIRYEIGPVLDLALRLRPQARRVVVVAGTGEFDAVLVRLARSALQAHDGKLEASFLVDRSLADTRAAVAKLAPDAVVLFLSMLRDGDGAPRLSRDVLSQLEAVSAAPLFGIFETYLGGGITAGSIASFDAQGRRTGELVARVLNGEQPGALGVQPTVPAACIADWKQLRRWGIDEALLPEGCEVRFRELSAWERYRWHIGAAVFVMLAQAALIAALLVNRYRRRQAELAVQQHRVELAHAGRLATMGELTATIAHEVNQPLGAILANVAAAEMLLESGGARVDDVRQILADVRKDDLRASEVIRRLRALLARHEMARERLDLNETIAEVLKVLGTEAGRRQTELATEFDPALPNVLGDRVHLQQVLLNLVVNAMDAMADTHVSARRVTVHTALRQDGSVEVAVADRGHGIARPDLSKLFDSFFTTKQRGMGLGLSIARSIVQAHGGAIWAESDARGGATFRFTLPAAEPGTNLAPTPFPEG